MSTWNLARCTATTLPVRTGGSDIAIGSRPLLADHSYLRAGAQKLRRFHEPTTARACMFVGALLTTAVTTTMPPSTLLHIHRLVHLASSASASTAILRPTRALSSCPIHLARRLEGLMLEGLMTGCARPYCRSASKSRSAFCAPRPAVRALLKEQNAARRRARGAAAARRCSTRAPQARARRRRVGQRRARRRGAYRRTPTSRRPGRCCAAAALLAAQAAEAAARQAWHVERAALLNGSDGFVPRAVALLARSRCSHAPTSRRASAAVWGSRSRRRGPPSAASARRRLPPRLRPAADRRRRLGHRRAERRRPPLRRAPSRFRSSCAPSSSRSSACSSREPCSQH